MLHLAEVIDLALRERPSGPPAGHRPEDRVPDHPGAGLTAKDAAVLGVAGAIAAAAVTWWARR